MQLPLPAPDKALHLIAGALAALAGLAAAHLIELDALWGAVGACAAAAVGREIYNRLSGGRFDLADIAWTLLGGLGIAGAAWIGL